MTRRLACAILLVLCSVGATPARCAPFDSVRTWQRTAWLSGAPLELSVRFVRVGGDLRATLSSHDLLLLEQPLDSVLCRERRVRFSTADEHPLRFSGV